jgi:hypothetical protein
VAKAKAWRVSARWIDLPPIKTYARKSNLSRVDILFYQSLDNLILIFGEGADLLRGLRGKL